MFTRHRLLDDCKISALLPYLLLGTRTQSGSSLLKQQAIICIKRRSTCSPQYQHFLLHSQHPGSEISYPWQIEQVFQHQALVLCSLHSQNPGVINNQTKGKDNRKANDEVCLIKYFLRYQNINIWWISYKLAVIYVYFAWNRAFSWHITKFQGYSTNRGLMGVANLG